MTKLEAAIEELKSLPSDKLDEVFSYLHGLKADDHAKKVAALKASHGILTDEAAGEMEKAIVEGCERVDARDW